LPFAFTIERARFANGGRLGRHARSPDFWFLPGKLYHLAHRCHDRQFLFKFAKNRNRYRRIMWENLDHFAVEVFQKACLGIFGNPALKTFPENSRRLIDETISQDMCRREPTWPEASPLAARISSAPLAPLRINGASEVI
jgi:hypothetical protein